MYFSINHFNLKFVLLRTTNLFFKDLKVVYQIKISIKKKSGIFSGKRLMFTGGFQNISRSEAKTIAEDKGGKVLGSISKKLDFLIVGNSKPTKKKIDQAKSLGIKVISEWGNFCFISFSKLEAWGR